MRWKKKKTINEREKNLHKEQHTRFYATAVVCVCSFIGLFYISQYNSGDRRQRSFLDTRRFSKRVLWRTYECYRRVNVPTNWLSPRRVHNNNAFRLFRNENITCKRDDTFSARVASSPRNTHSTFPSTESINIILYINHNKYIVVVVTDSRHTHIHQRSPILW